MIRVYYKDIYNLGLLYAYLYSNKKISIIKQKELNKFYDMIEKNLNQMNSNNSDLYTTLNDNEIIYYNILTDNNDETYCVLNDKIDLEQALNYYLSILSKETIKASQMNNALKYIGLEKVDEKIRKKK